MTHDVHIIGGGLAGSEAAWQLARRGVRVRLSEMRGTGERSPAHQTDALARNRAAHLSVLQRILEQGADLDQQNRYGMCARNWLEGAAADVREIVARWEQTKPAVRPSTTVQHNFPVNLHYPDIAYKIWTEHVPKTGTATTVYGELLQAVENLRDEAQRHANAHYRKRHKRMAMFIRDTLLDSRLFDETQKARIRTDTHLLMRASRPYTDDDIYDHLVDQVCVYYKEKPPRFMALKDR